MGVERSEVGRQEGEKETQATRECENERVSVFNQSGVGADNVSFSLFTFPQPCATLTVSVAITPSCVSHLGKARM